MAQVGQDLLDLPDQKDPEENQVSLVLTDAQEQRDKLVHLEEGDSPEDLV